MTVVTIQPKSAPTSASESPPAGSGRGARPKREDRAADAETAHMGKVSVLGGPGRIGVETEVPYRQIRDEMFRPGGSCSNGPRSLLFFFRKAWRGRHAVRHGGLARRPRRRPPRRR